MGQGLRSNKGFSPVKPQQVPAADTLSTGAVTALRPDARVAGATMTIDQAGCLNARIDLAQRLDHPLSVDVHCDGAKWATIPAIFAGDDRRILVLSFGLPHVAAARPADVALCWPGGGLIARQTMQLAPVTNAHGLAAHAVYDPAMAPMFSVPWLEFNGATIVISGAHLPPAGDPGRLSVEFGDGVSAHFDYPLPSPEFGAHYWYWPNAHHAGFRLSIDLPACAPGSDPFTFRFVDRDAEDGAEWQDRARIWIPHDLRSFIGYPGGTQLTRVQTWSEQKTVTLTGYNAFRGFESLLARHGVKPRAGLRLLDWGCGHGRVARHFIQNWPATQITGADIDAENISWCQANLPQGQFLVAPLMPPLHIADSTFDAIIGLSVMTHLTAPVQQAWLAEIHRILKPGGVALISFGGHGAAAFASFHNTPEWWAEWLRTGFDDGLADPALDGKIADAAYYRVTHQSPEQVRRDWTGRLKIEAIEQQAFGYQDIAVLRRA